MFYEIKSLINPKIGTRIRELRHSKGISQENFAKEIGMSRTYFANIEFGKRNVSLINID